MKSEPPILIREEFVIRSCLPSKSAADPRDATNEVGADDALGAISTDPSKVKTRIMPNFFRMN